MGEAGRKSERYFATIAQAANIAKHGISLRLARVLLSAHHIVDIDDRLVYGEERLKAVGMITGRVHVCVHTERGVTYWIISLRPATRRETDAYYRESHLG